MNSYSLSEWKTIEIKESLHSEDQTFLHQLRSSDRVEIEELKTGLRIRAKSWVGVIRFHNFQVQIVPKLAGGKFLVDMLMYSTGIRALKRYNSERYVHMQEQGSLFDLIAWLFCDACEVILAGGVLFDYEQVEADLANLRGRLLVRRQFQQRFGQFDRIECRYDEHSSNILENKLLAFGLLKAARFTEDIVIRNRVRRLAAIFSEVCQPNDLDLKTAREAMSYLDFIHLNINKKQGKLEQILDQEVAHAYLADRIYHDPGNLCEAVFHADLGTGEDLAHRSDPVSCRTNRLRGFAGDGVEW